MILRSFAAAAVAAVLLTATASSAPPHHSITQHDRQVIRFFNHHPRLAHTRAGEHALWQVVGHVADALRSLQTAYVVSTSTTWTSANAIVRHYFGNTIADWEWSCSSTEGGHSGFTWFDHLSYPKYGYSKTPGGQLQFMGGTFDSVILRALDSARSRGLVVPSRYATFYSPVGQAVAGAQMILDGRRGEWTGAGC